MFNHISDQMKQTGRRFPSVKKIIFTGGSLSRELADRLLRQFEPTSFRILYGLSEAVAPVTYTPANQICFDNIGFPGCNMQMKVIDKETGLPLGHLEHGELCVRTPSVIRGYFTKGQRPLPAADNDGWIHTGDLGYYNDDGSFQFVERLKNIIKCFDYNVAPCEIEAVLLKHPNVAEAVVIGTPHSVCGEAPTAFVVRTEEPALDATTAENELKELVAGELASCKHLYGGVFFVDSIARTANGKISREKMKQYLKSLP
ncbi:unnamed protein product [Ixodes hexagonus]